MVALTPVKALRFDVSKLDAAKRDQNGYLQAEAPVTRTGVFIYRHPDGSVTRELRHPDDVFKKDSLSTLQHRPITAGHPPNGRLDASNTKHIAVGTAVGDITHDERLVKTGLQIVDEDTITKVLDDENPMRELSCAYEAEISREDGMFNGEKYDHRQRNIIYNHIALVKHGRAGHDVRMTLDAVDAEQTDGAEQDFVSKCMADPKKRSEYPDQKQRSAVCFSMFRKGNRGDDFEDHFRVDAEETAKEITVQVSAEQSENESTTTMEMSGVEGVKAVFIGERKSSTIKKFVFTKSAGWTLDKAKEWAENHRHDSLEEPETPTRNDNMSEKITIRQEAIATKTFKADAVKVSLDGTADSAEKAIDQVKDRLDAAVAHIVVLEGKNQALQGKLDAAGEGGRVNAQQLNTMARERADACGAAHHLGIKNFDKLETDAIKKAVVVQAYRRSIQDMDPEDFTPEYIQGRYDAALDKIKSDNKTMGSLANLKEIATNPDLFGSEPQGDGQNPRDDFIKDTADMWKTDAERQAANA